MSVTAGLMVTAIVLIRAAGLKKLPKTMFLLLWGLVLFRLLVPVSIPAPFSMYNGVQTVVARISSDVTGLPPTGSEFPTDAVPWVPGTSAAQVGGSEVAQGFWTAPASAGRAATPATIVWISGIAVMLVLLTVIYRRNRRKLRFAVRIQGNDFLDEWQREHSLRRPLAILQSDRIQTPIAVGLLKPRIILPKSMDLRNEQLVRHVLMHELCHIKRLDALWKLLIALALCIHWFNPLVWIMFVLANRDLELTCDEKVVRHFGADTKEAYASSLIRMAEQRGKFASLYSGFSKHAVTERVESIMKMKKASFVAIAVAVAAAAALVVVALASSNADTPDAYLSDSTPQTGVTIGRDTITIWGLTMTEAELEEVAELHGMSVDEYIAELVRLEGGSYSAFLARHGIPVAAADVSLSGGNFIVNEGMIYTAELSRVLENSNAERMAIDEHLYRVACGQLGLHLRYISENGWLALEQDGIQIRVYRGEIISIRDISTVRERLPEIIDAYYYCA